MQKTRIKLEIEVIVESDESGTAKEIAEQFDGEEIAEIKFANRLHGVRIKEIEYCRGIEIKPPPVVNKKHKPAISFGDTNVYVLGVNDALAWNTSTNYDYYMNGASLVFENNSHGQTTNEFEVNDFERWALIDFLVHLGWKAADNLPGDSFAILKKEFEEKRRERKERVSIHADKK